MIRQAAPDDAAVLAAIEHEAFGAEAWREPQVREELTGPGRRSWVALVAGEPVGYAVTRSAGEVVDLQRIAVTTAHRRAGLGRRLLAEALATAGRDGADRVLLEVSAGNTAAMRCYVEAGFTAIDRRPRYYRDGTDAVVMRRSLARGCSWG